MCQERKCDPEGAAERERERAGERERKGGKISNRGYDRRGVSAGWVLIV